MRILHIVNSLPTKERPFDKPFIVSQIDSLKNNGVDIDIFNLNAKEKTINYVKGILKLRRMLSQKKYDGVHAHYSYCGWCAVFQRKVPVVVSLMGNDLYGILNNKGNQTLLGYFNIISTRILVRIAKIVIVKSNKMRKMIDYEHVFAVPNGVDFSKFRPFDERKKTLTAHSVSPQRILFLGNPVSRRKNFSLALRAHEIVKKTNPNVNLVNVFGVGQEEVIKFLNSSDVLLLTSTQEGSPNVIKEAMACNLSIVSTDVGDVKEVIGNTEGCYVTSFKPEDVAKKIQMALRFGKRTNGRENIKHLEINVIAKRIISIYEQFLKSI